MLKRSRLITKKFNREKFREDLRPLLPLCIGIFILIVLLGIFSKINFLLLLVLVLLLWFVILTCLEWPSNRTILFGMLLLTISPFFIIAGLDGAAERFADFSFFFLLAGALQALFSME